MRNNGNKGFAAIIPIIIVVGVLVLGGFLILKKQSGNSKPGTENKETQVGKDTTKNTGNEQPTYEKFEALEEDKTTPEEINNDVLAELDALMGDVDNNTSDSELDALGF
jgi:hypothetical protein